MSLNRQQYLKPAYITAALSSISAGISFLPCSPKAATFIPTAVLSTFSPEYIKDAGTPARLDHVERDYQTAAGIATLNHAGLRVVIVTNQPVFARGDGTESDLRLTQNRLETLLGREGAYVDRIYLPASPAQRLSRRTAGTENQL